MGYSQNISTLRAIQPQLQLLAAGQPCTWDRPSGDGHRWAYKIREALNVAEREVINKGEHADEFIKQLAVAKKHFTIRTISQFKVEASFKTSAEESLEPTPTDQGKETSTRSHTIGEIKTLEDLIAIWHDRQPTNTPIHFPNALLSDTDLVLAADWAATLQPPWMLLRPRGTNALTLAPNDPQVPAGAKVKGSLTARPRAGRNDVDLLPAGPIPDPTAKPKG